MVQHISDIKVLPYEVTLTGGATVRVLASSKRRACEKALFGRRKGCKVTNVEAIVAHFGTR